MRGEAAEATTSRGRGGRRREGGLVDDGDLEGAFAFAAAFPVLVCFLELAGLFLAVVFFVSFVGADEDLPPRRVAGAFLLLPLLLLGLFETDAIGGIDVDADVFFFFETVAAFAFAPSGALTDERVLRAIDEDGAKEKRGLKSKRN